MKHWYDFAELLDRTKLKELVDAGLSVRELSLRAGCSRQCVETALKRHGLTAKGQRGVMPRFIRRAAPKGRP
ncbi:MAG: hypothetical protein Q7J08_00160 [Methanocorpusculum sp.]|uniref:hypothetical protein n=1 Tax=Methanocorpusculum sp. TaxID=2058474 RepID=UPI0027277598|nr:hypothetical protein [Methanocorpusculum sp.]MDO9522119.1 hypothetical protein [Methanocorpusculum sp.]